MKTTIFISSVQKELAAERRALKDYIQGDLRTPPVLTEASRPGRASDGRPGSERVLAAPRRRNAPVWPTGRHASRSVTEHRDRGSLSRPNPRLTCISHSPRRAVRYEHDRGS
jgi:hypothetical protein